MPTLTISRRPCVQLALGLFFWAVPLPLGFAQTAVTILHTSEHHGTLEPLEQGSYKGQGGMARRATLIERVRKEAPLVLLVDSGDLLIGTAMSSVFRGEADIKAMNLMAYDALALGNHDFDFGTAHLKKLKNEARFPFLCTNLRPREPDICDRFIVKSIGPLRIGIIGLIGKRNYPDTFNRQALQELHFEDPVEAARHAVSELRERVEIIVAVTHEDTEEDLALAAAIPAIDVIVGGHTEGFDGLISKGLRTPEKERVELSGAGAVFVKTHRQGRTLGRLDLLYHDRTILVAEARNVPVTSAVTANPKVSQLVESYAGRLETETERVIGDAAVNLEGGNMAIRTRETNLGNLLADLSRGQSGAEIGFVNAGQIRGGFSAGPITRRRLMEVLPFDDGLCLLTLTGRELREALENSVSRLPEANGRFLQISGLSYVFDPAAPVGSRVKTMQVNQTPLDLSRHYTVVTSQFLADGGDGYTMFMHAGDRQNLELPLRDVLSAALKVGPLTAREESRIRRVGAQDDAAK